MALDARAELVELLEQTAATIDNEGNVDHKEDGNITVPVRLLRDLYDVVDDLMAGVGGLALSADQLARINDSSFTLEKIGIRQIPNRLADK